MDPHRNLHDLRVFLDRRKLQVSLELLDFLSLYIEFLLFVLICGCITKCNDL